MSWVGLFRCSPSQACFCVLGWSVGVTGLEFQSGTLIEFRQLLHSHLPMSFNAEVKSLNNRVEKSLTYYDLNVNGWHRGKDIALHVSVSQSL